MAHLSLSLLGPFQVTLDGQPATDFKSNKVRALLAYLAVEAEQPHRRQVLAALLWPDWPDCEALSHLRYALSNLRQVIGDRDVELPFLLITRDTLQFNTDSDYRLDVAALSRLVAMDESGPSAIDQLEEAVDLYRGSFLEGFSVDDSPGFEEWAFFTRQQAQSWELRATVSLCRMWQEQGETEQACERLVEIYNWFTEGFDSPDLKEARTLLEELSPGT